ncbi:MAG: universal stress protein [Cyclobacteriaceae bacterium]
MAALKIVLLTDFSPLSKVALQYALKMSGKLEAEYTVLNVVRLDGVPKSNMKLRQIEKTLVSIAEEEGKHLLKELHGYARHDLKIEFKALRGHTVAEAVKRYAEKNKPSLVVMGSKGASSLKKARLGGTTVSVIDVCPAPVLAIPELAHFKDFSRVIYASDLKNVQKELDTIVPFARIFGSHLHMIHVTEAIDKKMDHKKEEVEALIRKANYDKLDFRLIIDDNIPEAIDAFIQHTKADLLTTFTHELNLFEKLFARSVTRHLAYQGSIPLLAFKRW